MKLYSRSRRTPRLLSDSLHRQLNMYALAASAAGVGVLAMAQSAEAKIIYTPAHLKVPLNTDFFLDLNHDGVNDFKFHIFTTDGDCSTSGGFPRPRQTRRFRPDSCNSIDAAWVNLFPLGNAVVGQGSYASALQAGIRIGPKGPFVSFNTLSVGAVEYFPVRYYGKWANKGKPVDHHFLGFKFLINGKIHYGWARLNVWFRRDPESDATVTITGYAYETIANRPIIAGKECGEEDGAGQPATLGRLALGKK